MRGMVRSVSSSRETGENPGLVDSPPISRAEQPFSMKDSALESAASKRESFFEEGVRSPSPEKESGVQLIMPTTVHG